MKFLRCLVALALALLPFSEARAASGVTQIQVKDAAGTTRNIDVTSDTGAITGNLLWNNVICDPTTVTQCMAVSAGGAASVSAAQSGTWNVGTVTTVTTVGTLTTVTNPVTAAQATAANLNATVVGTGTFATQLTGATNNINNIAGTISLPTGAATSANQATEISSLASIVTNTGAAIPTGTNTIGNINGAPNVTPTDCSIALTTGATAQNIITAGATLHGFTIANIDTAAGSGEPVWMSFTGTAVAGAIASYPLAAPTATTFANLSSFTTPVGFGTNANVSVIAATTGHKISCTKW